MATKHVDIDNYCQCLYSELSTIRDSLDAFITQIDLMEGKDREQACSHIKHLNELMQNVEWKMEIFSKECPVDWKMFGQESSDTASVPLSESMKEKDFPAGGYAGG